MKPANFLILVFMAASLGSGCGIKGPPLPPIETVEDKTVNSAAQKETVVSPTTTVKEIEKAEPVKKKK